MTHEADIKEFEQWALNLGCPLEYIPPKNVLTRIFKSGQALAFADVMRKVKPQQEVKRIRDRITVHKIKKTDGKLLSNVSKQRLPEEMQRYFKMRKLREQIGDTEQRVSDIKSQYHKLADSVKQKNINKLQMKRCLDELNAKNAILKVKNIEVENQSHIENEVLKTIRDVMPVRIEHNNANATQACNAITEAITVLETYYANFNNSSYEVTAHERDELWVKLRQIFANIPNYILWNSICKLKDQQVSMVNVMSKTDLSKKLQVDNIKGPETGFKVAISKMYALHISMMADKHLLKKEKKRLLNDYVVFYNSFVTNLRARFAMYNNTDIDDEFLDEYVNQYSGAYYNQAQIEFLERAIEANDKEISQRAQTLNDHNLMTNSLRYIYTDIENLYCRIREDMNTLIHVKEKIEYNENLLKYLIQRKNDQQGVTITANHNNSSSSSFNSLNESMFSTMDSTMMSIRSQNIIARPNTAAVPDLVGEIKTFLDMPIAKLRCQLSLKNLLVTEGNVFIKSSVFDNIPKSLRNFITEHLLTSHAALEQWKHYSEWYGKEMELLKEVNVSKQIPEVNEIELMKLKQKQIENVAEIMDKTTMICSNTKEILNNIERYYKFMKENPMRKYVPKTKLFDGLTYYDYEREFLLYYNMIAGRK